MHEKNVRVCSFVHFIAHALLEIYCNISPVRLDELTMYAL